MRCISEIEAFAEKFRAALSRRQVAIRDFYDLDYGIRKLLLRPEDAQMVELLRQKLAIPGNEPLDTSEQRLAELRQQVEAQLRPVLRESDFREFDLERAFRIVTDMAARVA
ncbi:MAG: nucleotidyl transferase AbiEii/AbiGii toxin family protein [Pyrinomonadaceae bacterium]|nr:nucleotidyl transferase AbiEii/AbiGii toxin family protein [Pyrinomonadaceae bacterium]